MSPVALSCSASDFEVLCACQATEEVGIYLTKEINNGKICHFDQVLLSY